MRRCCQSLVAGRAASNAESKNRSAGKSRRRYAIGVSKALESAMSFRVTGLSAAPFRSLYGLSDQELALRGVKRYVADKKPGFPDRIEMRDAEIGEKLLLLNHVC